KLDAKQYAATTARPPKDPFKWNQYGFTLGGPVWIPKLFNGRNKLFFMSNYEAFRQRRHVQATYDLPSAAMRTGDFSELLAKGITIYNPATRMVNGDDVIETPFQGNLIPDSMISSTAKKLMEFYPPPNLPTSTLVRNRQQAVGRPIN